MTSKDDFEARVKRIQQSRGVTFDPVPGHGPASDWQLPGKPRRKGGRAIKLGVAGLLTLGALIFAAPIVTARLGLTAPVPNGDGIVANLSADVAQGGPQMALAGLVDSLFGTRLAGETEGDPIAYLPEAPAGWLRVTTADAQQADALAQLATRWPAPDQPINAHPGYGDLAEFVRVYDSPDAEQRLLSATRTRALYLGPEGQMLSLRLQFRSAGETLGTTEDPASWADALRAEVTNATQLGDTVETFDLGGLTVFNRAPQGQVGAAQRTAVAPLDLTVALHPRAVVEIRGTAQPSAAIALIEGVNRAALSSRLAQN